MASTGDFEAKDFLDGRAGEARICLELGKLAGMGEQQPDAVADEIGGCQVAADQKAAEIHVELGVADVGAERDHVAHQIVPGCCAPRRYQRREVTRYGVRAPDHALRVFLGAQRRQRKNGRFGPGAEFRQPLLVHAQDARDDQDRDRKRHLRHQVERRPARHTVQGFPDDGIDLRPHLRDACVKRLHERRADPRMVGIVEEENGFGFAIDRIEAIGDHHLRLRHRPLLCILGMTQQGPVVDDGADVAVTQDHPRHCPLVAEDGALRLQRPEQWIGIGAGLGIECRRFQKSGGWRRLGHGRSSCEAASVAARSAFVKARFHDAATKLPRRFASDCGPDRLPLARGDGKVAGQGPGAGIRAAMASIGDIRNYVGAWLSPLMPYERHLSAAAMAAGFAVDNYAFGRVDHPATHLILAGYLLLPPARSAQPMSCSRPPTAERRAT